MTTDHTRTFIYDSAHRLIERIDNDVTTDYVTLGRMPIARIQSGQTTYILPNYQNSPLFELNPAGQVTRAPVFRAYGRPANLDAAPVTGAQAPNYIGATLDPATGLLYLGARFQTGPRFLSPDPVGLNPLSPTGLNRYAYAADNPARYVDPFGLYACSSKTSSADCAKIDKFVGKIHQSMKGLNRGSSDYKALSAVSKFLGAKNDHNGVTIQAASLGKNVAGEPSGMKTISLNMKAIAGPLASNIKSMNSGMSAKEAGVVAGGDTLAHETQHLIDANKQTFNPTTMQMEPQGLPSGNQPAYEMILEQNAYDVEGAYGRGLGVDVGSSNQAAINANALESCQTQGSCP